MPTKVGFAGHQNPISIKTQRKQFQKPVTIEQLLDLIDEGTTGWSAAAYYTDFALPLPPPLLPHDLSAGRDWLGLVIRRTLAQPIPLSKYVSIATPSFGKCVVQI